MCRVNVRGLGSSESGQRQVESSYEHGNGYSASIKGGEFLENLSNY
jgi:hypothetical protein